MLFPLARFFISSQTKTPFEQNKMNTDSYKNISFFILISLTTDNDPSQVYTTMTSMRINYNIASTGFRFTS